MATSRPVTILHVEDDAGIRSLLGNVLRMEGFIFQEAATGAEALRLAVDRPDLILLDIRLPDMSGIEVCRRIKADPQTASTLVLYLSGHTVSTEDKAFRLEGGADGYLGKPVDPLVVVAHIKALLRLRHAEASARAAAQQWRTTFDAVRDAICLLDHNGTVLRCNRAMADLVQRSFLNIVGYSYEELMHAVAGNAKLPGYHRIHETRRRETSELAIGERWFRVSADPVLDEQEGVIGTVHLFADITERKQSEQTLAQLAAIVESSDEAMIGTTLDGVVLNWNPAAEYLFGFAASEVKGQSVALIVPPDRKDELTNNLARIRRGERVDYYETVVRRKDGRILDVAMTVSPIRDSQGTVLGASGILRDITEQKRLEDQIRQAQKMEAVGRLAGGIAHDFNNLLTIILGYGQVVLSQLPREDASAPLVSEVMKAGERAATLTRQLLAFSRRQVLAPRVVDLNSLVVDIEKMLRRLIGEDITLEIRQDPALERVQADPGQIDLILLNLAVNARDAMPRGGRLLIETSNVDLDEAYVLAHPDARPGPCVLLSISDTGTGIPPDLLPHIFEPFFTTKEVGKGTGLGLSTVYGVVRQSDGHISVASEPGKGTTFKIFLPRTALPLTTAPSHTLSSTLSGNQTILVVEDEENVRQYTAFALRKYRYKILEASCGDEALRVAGKYPGPIHLLLTDVVMPEMSGRELATRLAKAHPESRVLYFSGYPGDAIVRHGIHTAEMNFLQKPFRPDTLARKVREVLDAPASRVVA
ncbi:MAG TPA: PAS domain S-box protein [Gemmataceae bacterium]|jgi:PAS domain S-box-containing protein|nr:PAS domain S-box protein [Gemmataceae bacterium]